MSLALVSDDLWEAIQPLLPKEPPKPKGGRPRVPDRAALGDIVFVLWTGTPWRLLPQELGRGSGSTCWRRLRDWHEVGVWERLHATVLNWLGDGGRIDRSRASADTGPNPVDRGKHGRKYHLLVDRSGMPLVDAVPPLVGPRGRPGRPRFRPAKLHADKAYDSKEKRRALRCRGIAPRIARRGVESSERLGRCRWIVERTLAWLLGFRRLGVRCERRSDLLVGLLHLACALICIRGLPPVS